MLWLFLFSFFNVFSITDGFVWDKTDIRIPVYDDSENYFYLPRCSYNGTDVSYIIGVDGTSKTIVNTSCLGHYQVIYEAKYNGKISKCKVNFYVYDDIPPEVIYYEKDIYLPIYGNKPNLVDGIIFKDNYSYNDEIKLSCDDSRVDYLKIGDYLLYYTLEDLSGNQAYFYAYLHIFDDIPPNAKYKETLYTQVGSINIDYYQGLEISDNYDDECIVVCDTSQVDFGRCGSYLVFYFIYDQSGNCFILKRPISVLDFYGPKITLGRYFWYEDLQYEISSAVLRYNIVEVKDNFDLLTPEQVMIDFKYEELQNRYRVVYYIFDSSDNYGEAILYINLGDYVKPYFEGKSQNIMLNSHFDPYEYIKASDNLEGDITDKVMIEFNNVNPCVEGLYKVIYSVYDQFGNFTIKELYFNVTTPHAVIEEPKTTSTTIDIPYNPDEKNDDEKIEVKPHYEYLIVVALVPFFVIFIIWRYKKKKAA